MTRKDSQQDSANKSLADSPNLIDPNPQDSLQHYFDDLLLGSGFDELGAALENPLSATAKSLGEPAPEQPLTLNSPVKQIQRKHPVPEPRFADPIAQQKENLQKLLHSVQPKIELAPTEKLAIAAPITVISDVAEIQEWDIGSSAPPEIVVQAEPMLAEASITRRNPVSDADWLANGLPSWAQSQFDVLLVKVSGLTLAVPLISLGQIQPLNDELTHIFGQADWFIGIQPTLSGKIRVVNTAKFVMPERYDENFIKTAKLLVSINGVPWGLAVDSVEQPISLAPKAVKWRTDRSKRPWLAGVIKEKMCVLLDIPMIGQLLMESDKNLVKNSL